MLVAITDFSPDSITEIPQALIGVGGFVWSVDQLWATTSFSY